MDPTLFLQESFQAYYRLSYSAESILGIDKREFGSASFEGRMLRHRSFKNGEELTLFLRDFVPRDAYVSSAYYEDPEADMEKKEWLGADLVFDIDADHIPTDCHKIHDEWVCSNCSFPGRGVVPEKCPACSGERFHTSTWPCEACLVSARKETVKLLDMLMYDFGFSEKEVHVFFSGNRGYHVHVEDESAKTLDAVARREIIDYVCGLGLNIFAGAAKDRRTAGIGQTLRSGSFGWPKRISSGMKEFILSADEQDLWSVGLGKKEAKILLSNKDAILRNLSKIEEFGNVKGLGFETWRKIAEHSAKAQSAKVDTVVTTDIHRLIRLQGTLHGKTGLKKVEFPASTIDDFDPFRSTIAFKSGTVTVFVSRAPEFRLGDQVFGPYRDQKVELPTAAAVLLVCRGRAEVVK